MDIEESIQELQKELDGVQEVLGFLCGPVLVGKRVKVLAGWDYEEGVVVSVKSGLVHLLLDRPIKHRYSNQPPSRDFCVSPVEAFKGLIDPVG